VLREGVAAKAGGGVIENNPSLRMVIDKALAANMKRDTIESAVKRGSGDLDGDNYEFTVSCHILSP
jgi:transcriptional/translational regulatory protein YebC/TACO1